MNIKKKLWWWINSIIVSTPPTEFVLMEDTGFILLESGDKIGIEN